MARISDRYVKAALSVIALALAMLAGQPMDHHRPGFQGGRAALEPSQPQTMPKAWGKVAGATVDRWLVFEAADGTIRLVALGGNVMRDFKRN